MLGSTFMTHATPELLALARRPLEAALTQVAVDHPGLAAEMRAAIDAWSKPFEIYDFWLSQHHPALTYWCAAAAAFERRVGRPRLPGEFTPEPLLEAIETLHKTHEIWSIRLPATPREWRDVEHHLAEAHRRRALVF